MDETFFAFGRSPLISGTEQGLKALFSIRCPAATGAGSSLRLKGKTCVILLLLLPFTTTLACVGIIILGRGEGSLARNDVLIRRRELTSKCSSSPPQRKKSFRSWCSRKMVGNVALQRSGLVYSASAYLLHGHMAARDATKTVESRSSLRNDGGRDLGRRPSRRPLALHALPMNRYISQLGLSSRRVDSMKFAPVIYEAL